MTASDLASLCEVDLKTIHNWVDRGKIPHFRTPGRHLRFRPADVADFLRAWGYSVPRELARAGAKSVMVIGSSDAASLVTRAAAGAPPPKHVAHAYDALVHAGAEPADVYVVELAGVEPHVDAVAMIDALKRACPNATFVALGDEAVDLPSFVTRLARNDTQALASILVPADEAAPPEPALAAAAR